jgi:hypothetical protein
MAAPQWEQLPDSTTRRLGLHCPNCDRSLSGPLSRRVVESGNCSHCGAAIF